MRNAIFTVWCLWTGASIHKIPSKHYFTISLHNRPAVLSTLALISLMHLSWPFQRIEFLSSTWLLLKITPSSLSHVFWAPQYFPSKAIGTAGCDIEWWGWTLIPPMFTSNFLIPSEPPNIHLTESFLLRNLG